VAGGLKTNARTQIAFFQHRKFQKGEIPLNLSPEKIQAKWLMNLLLIHIITDLPKEDVDPVMKKLLENIPGSDQLRILVSKPDEKLRIETLNQSELANLGLQKIGL
jgi:hypothetical protein